MNPRLNAILIALLACTALAFPVTGVASTRQSATPIAVVPIQVQFVNPPLYFGWNRVMIYHIQITSISDTGSYFQLALNPYLQLTQGVPSANEPSAWFYRKYYVYAHKTLTVQFRIKTSAEPYFGAAANWCVSAWVSPKGAAAQSETTCSLSPEE